MVSTRKFTGEEQQILENFIKSNKIYDLVNDKIYDTKKCRKWVNENSKIKDALNKNFNSKSELDIKDKFLWILSDIINCQLDEKATLQHKQINTMSNLKELLILIGVCAEIKEIEDKISENFIENNQHLAELGKTCLDHYSFKKKNFIPSNRLTLVLKEINKNSNSSLSNMCNDDELIENIDDLILYVDGKEIPQNFKELEEENFEKSGIKHKYEDEYQDENDNIATEKEVCMNGQVIDLDYSEFSWICI